MTTRRFDGTPHPGALRTASPYQHHLIGNDFLAITLVREGSSPLFTGDPILKVVAEAMDTEKTIRFFALMNCE
jgi:hypothetical protein